jgi:hypothetical protein
MKTPPAGFESWTEWATQTDPSWGVWMKNPSELSDPQLDEAVAREIFNLPIGLTCDGGINDGDRWSCDTCPKWGQWGDEMNHLRLPPEYTTDARDADRVWDWLVAECKSISVTRNRDGHADIYADATYQTPSGVLVPGHIQCYDGEDWKRALCIAALSVARKERG